MGDDLSYFEDIFKLYTNGENVFEINRNIQLNYVHTYFLFLLPSNENVLEIMTIKSPEVQNIEITAVLSIGMFKNLAVFLFYVAPKGGIEPNFYHKSIKTRPARAQVVVNTCIIF